MPPPPGSDQIRVDPRRKYTGKVSESEEEDPVDTDVNSSSSEDDRPLSERYVLKSRAFDKAGSSTGASKRLADSFEDALPPPPKKPRTTVAKRVVGKVLIPQTVPSEVSLLTRAQDTTWSTRVLTGGAVCRVQRVLRRRRPPLSIRRRRPRKSWRWRIAHPHLSWRKPAGMLRLMKSSRRQLRSRQSRR